MEDLIQQMNNKKFQIVLPSHLWENIDANVLKIVQDSKWTTFKYLDINQELNSEVSKVNNHKGGIYIFYVSPEIIKERQRILMYVGRARITRTQNLRKRIKEYYGYLPPNYSRPKVNTMMREWSKFLYCSYIELDDNAQIDLIEKELIRKLIPPFNDQIPDQEIAYAAKSAFI